MEKTFVSALLINSDIFFNSSTSFFILKKKPSHIITCNGNYITHLIKDKHNIDVIFENKQYELSTSVINSSIYMYGTNFGDKFSSQAISDDKNMLINKILENEDSSFYYFICGLMFGISAVGTIINSSLKHN